MRAFSLFSGAGGFDLGFERAGITVVAQCEIDSIARSVLDRHWPDVPVIEDVKDVLHGERRPPMGSGVANADGAGRATPAPSGVDLIFGGFPCTDLSKAGRRAGLAGEHSGLWWEFHRVLRELRPAVAAIENVPGLLTSNGGRDFAVLLHSLEDLGYGWAYRILDAQYFGVSQRRRRVFIVGCAGADWQRSAQILALCDSCSGNAPTSETERDGSAGRAARGVGYGGFVRTIQADEGVRGARGDGTDNLVVAKQGVRKLMPIECERLQGWPDNWTALGADGKRISDTARYRLIGNGVASPVAEWIGRRILAYAGSR